LEKNDVSEQLKSYGEYDENHPEYEEWVWDKGWVAYEEWIE